MKLAKR